MDHQDTRFLLLAPLALAVLAPSPAAAVRGVAAGGPASLVALVALGSWACAIWLGAVAALTSISVRRGRAARVAAAVLGRLAPRAVRAAVGLAFGVTLATAVVEPASALAAPHATTVAAPSAHQDADLPPDLDWPPVPPPPATVTTGGSRPSARPPARTAAPATGPSPATATTGATTSATTSDTPALTRTSATATTSAMPADSRTATSTAATPRATPADTRTPTTATATATADAPSTAVVIVQPGDCLWRLAGRALGAAATPARTAAAWPTWWAANRSVIGDDPDLLMPGTRLVPPRA